MLGGRESQPTSKLRDQDWAEEGWMARHAESLQLGHRTAHATTVGVRQQSREEAALLCSDVCSVQEAPDLPQKAP